MSTGHWVKIRVDHEGLYEITYDQLRQWGFANPESVTVYGFGGTMLTHGSFYDSDPDDLTPTVCFHLDKALRFYGIGAMRWLPESYREINLEQNIYSNYGYYFVSDVKPEAGEDKVILRESSGKLATAVSAFYGVTEDVENPVKAGGFFVGKPYEANELHTFKVSITNFAEDCIDPVFTINARYAANFGINGVACADYDSTKLVSVSRTAYDVPSLTSTSDRNFYLSTYKESFSSLATDGTLPDTVKTFTFGPEERIRHQVNYMADDYLTFSYPQRAFKRDGEATVLCFVCSDQWQNFVVRNCDSNTLIYDVTYATPRLKSYETKYDSEARTLTGCLDRTLNNITYPWHARMLVVNPTTDAVSVPEYVGEVANQNIHGDDVPDMLVITTDELYEAAQELAEAHRAEGLKVNVYTQQQVFNEFTSGTPDIAAYRRVLKMFYDRDSERMKYLLLYGRGIWDNRQIVEKTNNEVLLSYENPSTIFAGSLSQAYVGDGVLGVMADNVYLEKMHAFEAEIAVGRIPADNLQMARDANVKIINYMKANVPFINFTRGVFISDDGDGYTHLNQTEQIIKRIQAGSPAVTAIRVHNDIFPWTGKDAKTARTVLSDALIKGVGLFCYVGHGTPDGFTGEKLWTRSFATSLNIKYPPLAHLSTCDSYAFDHRDSGIAEAMFFKKDGGSIGVIGACRAVYMQMNQYLALSLADVYGKARYGTTVGDIYRLASNQTKKKYNNDDYVTLNTCCYNLLGDPAVRLPFPMATDKAPKIERFNDVNVSNYEPGVSERTRNDACEIVPGQKFTVEGGMIGGTGFDGTADVTVYQSPRTVTTLVQNSQDRLTPKDVTIEQDVLAETVGTCTEGRATVGVTVPQPMTAGEYNRIVLTLTNSDMPSTGVAAVYDEAYIDDDAAEVQPDYANAPQIEQMYLNDNTSTQDIVVGKDFTLHATVRAASGFSVSSDLGAATRLTMDHNKSYHDVLYNVKPTDDPEVFELTYPMNDVADGRHVLTLDVADNTGARTSTDLAFTVMSSQASMNIVMDVTTGIVRHDCTFNATSENTSVVGPYRLIICDANGNTVYNKTVSLPCTWNLKDKNDAYVSDGRYTARILAGDSDSAPYGSTNTITFTVLRKK